MESLVTNASEKKVKEYESFIENLKSDLAEIQAVLVRKVDKYKEWEEVKQVVQTMTEFKEKDRDMAVRVEVGSGIYATGEVKDYETVLVNVGLDHLLEMEREEAVRYADIRLRSLKKEVNYFRDQAVKIKVHMKFMLLGIDELRSAVLAEGIKKL